MDFKGPINKLKELLEEKKIPCEVGPMHDGFTVIVKVYDIEGEVLGVMDAVCHGFSYGNEGGYVEIMGGLTEEESERDSVLGWLTPEEAAERFAYCYTHHTCVYKESK